MTMVARDGILSALHRILTFNLRALPGPLAVSSEEVLKMEAPFVRLPSLSSGFDAYAFVSTSLKLWRVRDVVDRLRGEGEHRNARMN